MKNSQQHLKDQRKHGTLKDDIKNNLDKSAKVEKNNQCCPT